MADYYPLIARAVAGLEKNTGDARRVLYERARAALVAQLRSVSPALSESDVTRERLALEEAIRKVEGESARQTKIEPIRSEPLKMQPPPPRWEEPAPAPPAPPPAPPPRRSKSNAVRQEDPAPRRAPPPPPDMESERRSEPTFDQPMPAEPTPMRNAARPRPTAERRSVLDAGLKDFRDVVSETNELGGATARAARSARDVFEAVPPPPRDLDRGRTPQEQPFSDDDYPEQTMLEPSFTVEDSRPLPPRTRPAQAASDEGEAPRGGRSFMDILKITIAAVILLAIAGLLVWQWPNIVALYRMFGTPTQVTKESPNPSTRSKIPDRLEPGSQPQGGTSPAPQGGAAVAQRVVLYEEDPADPQGKRFVGSAIWRTETVSPGPGLPPELAVRADIEIPERRIAMTWSLRRNTDQGLPASHTVEIMFKLPPDFPSGGISNVPGILMKQAEQTRGVPLAGLAVKVTNGFFLIGLSNVETDKERNLQLLKERSWFDIPVVYNNNRRAILAMEKGTPGERAFADAFKAWGQ
jgi:hypothetical protein